MEIKNISEDKTQKVYDLLNEILKVMQSEFLINTELCLEENIEKYLSQNIKVKTNTSEFLKNLNILLNEITKNNLKTYILFYDSNITNFEFNNSSYYTFDINNYKEANEYNIIINNSIYEFNYEIIIEHLKTIWPTSYKSGEIEKLLNNYFKYYISHKKVEYNDEKLYLIANMIKEEYQLEQINECVCQTISTAIKSYIDKK